MVDLDRAASTLRQAIPEWFWIPQSPKLDKRADAALIERIRAELEETDRGEPVSTLPRARDYYRIEDSEGRRFWLFRQGLYEDGRGGAPLWFMHGLFA